MKRKIFSGNMWYTHMYAYMVEHVVLSIEIAFFFHSFIRYWTKAREISFFFSLWTLNEIYFYRNFHVIKKNPTHSSRKLDLKNQNSQTPIHQSHQYYMLIQLHQCMVDCFWFSEKLEKDIALNFVIKIWKCRVYIRSFSPKVQNFLY